MADAKPAPPQAADDARPSWLPGRSPQFAATVVVNLLAFSFGCAGGWPSVGGPLLGARGVSDEAVSWVAAVVWPAGLAGAALFGPLTERCGRRAVALVAALPHLLGWAALVAPDLWLGEVTDDAALDAANARVALWVTLAARCSLGVGMGATLIVCPMYVGEVVEDSLRGQLGSYMALFINAGILYVYAVGAQVGGAVLSVLCGAVPAAFLALFYWLPETPAFLLRRGDERGARKALAWLRGRHADVEGELRALRAALKQASEAGLRDLVATRGARRGLAIVMGLVALQQLSGITGIVNYAARIFEMAGSATPPDVAAVVVAGVQLAGSAASCALADALGRLPLLYASYGGMTGSLALLGACFFWPGALPAWLPVACLSVYIFVYAVGSGPMPFLLLVEVLPTRLRAVASQAALALLCTAAFLVAKFFSSLSDALGAAGCFWMFAGCCAAGVAFVCVAIPETKGRPVEDIVDQLEGRHAAKEAV